MTDHRRSSVPQRTSRTRESGQGLAEYGVMLALVACVSIVALLTLGGGITRAFSTVSDGVAGAAGAAATGAPTMQPTAAPTAQPNVAPTVAPTAQPTPAPTARATVAPEPTKKPHPNPSKKP